MEMKKRMLGTRGTWPAGMLRIVIVMMAVSQVPGTGLTLDLAAEGRAIARVVVPDEANPITDRAADVLVRYVAEITGAKLAIVREKDAVASAAPRVFLGATKAARAAGINLSELKYDGFVWKTVGGDLFIAGRDVFFASTKGATDFNKACQGTSRGVYRLLEDFGGVRWLLPSPKGVVVPKAKHFSVPDTLSRQEKPPFAYTLGAGLESLGEWSLANGQRSAHDVLIQGHSWPGALRNWGDPKALFEKDPTIFAMVKGKRLYTDSNYHLCPSHPDFVDMNVKYFSKLFDIGYQWVEYNQSDGWQRCECDKCNAMDQLDELDQTKGSYWRKAHTPNPHDKSIPPAERLWLPFYEIALRLYKKYPDRKIVTLAYGPTFIPSQKVERFPPNVMIALTRDFPEYFEQYAAFEKTIWTYWWGDYHVYGLTPDIMARQVAVRLHTLVDRGIEGVYVCGGPLVWGLQGPAYYVYARLSWNPRLDVDVLLDEYYRGVFHAAAPEMKKFFDLIEPRIPFGQATQTVKEQAENDRYIAAASYFPEAYPPGVLATLDNLLAQAKAKTAGDDFAVQWLTLTETQYRYLRIIAEGFTLYREYRYMRNKTPELCRELAAVGEARKTFIAECTHSCTNAWFLGGKAYLSELPDGGAIYGKVSHIPPFSAAFLQELARKK